MPILRPMETFTSTHFVSTAASGENWRDISKKVLEKLDSVKTDGFKPNVGFIYITEALAGDAGSILTLFRSVTGIEHWSGCAAMGICGGGAEFIEVPAISVLVGQVPADHVRAFSAQGSNLKDMNQNLEPWLLEHDPMLVVVHADPVEGNPAHVLEELETTVGGFMVGGLASSRKERAILGRDIATGGVSGFVFAADVAVASALSQGCIPMGPLHEVSRADNHVIAYLDGRAPVEVFSEEMAAMAEQRLGYKPKAAILESGGTELPKDLSLLLSGEAHVAFPVPGSDQNDFMVRNIVAMDPDTGAMAISDFLHDGQKMMFVHRDDDTVRTDLSATLVALHKRIVHERGEFKPKAALYISCVARAHVKFKEGNRPGGEMALLRAVLGDIPVAGFYAGGEISNNRLYGYTGVLALFL
jgi:small ligand-binding sensory domain FIST